MAELVTLIDAGMVKTALENITNSSLPDNFVLLPLYTDVAVTELLQLDPDAVAHAENVATAQYVSTALNLLTASAILPFVRQITREDFGDAGGYQSEKIDTIRLAGILRSRAEAQITLAKGNQAGSRPSAMPPFFRAASARRMC